MTENVNKNIYVKPYVQKIRNGAHRACVDVVIGRKTTETFESEFEFTFADKAYEAAFEFAQRIGRARAQDANVEFAGVILHEWSGSDA